MIFASVSGADARERQDHRGAKAQCFVSPLHHAPSGVSFFAGNVVDIISIIRHIRRLPASKKSRTFICVTSVPNISKNEVFPLILPFTHDILVADCRRNGDMIVRSVSVLRLGGTNRRTASAYNKFAGDLHIWGSDVCLLKFIHSHVMTRGGCRKKHGEIV